MTNKEIKKLNKRIQKTKNLTSFGWLMGRNKWDLKEGERRIRKLSELKIELEERLKEVNKRLKLFE